MDSITALNIVRDSLRTNLSDPYVLAGGTSRTWVYGSEPLSSTRYPMLQIKKISNPTEVISLGYNYTEYEQLFLNCWFSTKNGFKLTVGGVEYVNEGLVEYYLGQIKQTLKAQASVLHSSGAEGYRHIKTSGIEYDPATQLYFGAVVVRVFYFNT